MSDLTKRIERLEAAANSQPTQEGPRTWKELVNWPEGETLPGWNEFVNQAEGGNHEHNPITKTL